MLSVWFFIFNRNIQNLGCLVFFTSFSVALLNYFLSLLTHRYMKKYLSESQFSSINYKQQQKLTWLLVGQGSMPLLMAAVICLIVLIGLPELLENKPPPKDVWEAYFTVLLVYSLLGPILTIVLTKPYYEALKLMLVCGRNKIGVTIIKL